MMLHEVEVINKDKFVRRKQTKQKNKLGTEFMGSVEIWQTTELHMTKAEKVWLTVLP